MSQANSVGGVSNVQSNIFAADSNQFNVLLETAAVMQDTLNTVTKSSQSQVDTMRKNNAMASKAQEQASAAQTLIDGIDTKKDFDKQTATVEQNSDLVKFLKENGIQITNDKGTKVSIDQYLTFAGSPPTANATMGQLKAMKSALDIAVQNANSGNTMLNLDVQKTSAAYQQLIQAISSLIDKINSLIGAINQKM